MLTNTDSLMTTFALHLESTWLNLVQYIVVQTATSYSLQLFWLQISRKIHWSLHL